MLHNTFKLVDKELVIIKGDDVLSKPPLLDTTMLALSNPEEANSCIPATLLTIASRRFSSIQLTLMTWQKLWHVPWCRKPNWVSFGMEKMTWALGPEKSQAIPMIGCDTSLPLQDLARGRHEQFYLNWPRLTDLSTAPDHIDENAMCTYFMNEQTLQSILTRHDTICLQRKAMSSWSHPQVQRWSSISDK